VQVLVDASDPTASQSAIAAAQLVGQRTNMKLVSLRAGTAGGPATRLPVDVRVRPLYNPALANAIFIVPGLIGMILSNTLIIITALTVVRERETGTLEQLIVTPLAKWEIMLGKIAPYVLVGYMQLTTVLVVGHFVFHVPVRGPLLALYGASFLFIVASLGLGLFVSTLGRNQAQVMQTAFLFLLPNILLSGFMWPREAMPAAARYAGIFLPLTHYLRLVRGIVLKGNGLTEVWPQLLSLAVFAFLFFMFSTWRFSKTLE
jgi:ABC-2 type transport system permease protein